VRRVCCGDDAARYASISRQRLRQPRRDAPSFARARRRCPPQSLHDVHDDMMMSLMRLMRRRS